MKLVGYGHSIVSFLELDNDYPKPAFHRKQNKTKLAGLEQASLSIYLLLGKSCVQSKRLHKVGER